MTARTTRRQLIASGGGVALAAALFGPGAAARAATLGLPAYRRSSYTALPDVRFRVRPVYSVEWTELMLVEVADLPRAATLAKYRGAEWGFSLSFEGPPALPQDTYRVRNPSTRPVDMFLTPIGPAGDTQRYEAVIDRLYAPSKRHPAPRRRQTT
ncbi:MAG TPA: hypothetical protein VF533_16260 [Solirubrobacteraceae bacterium]